MLVPFAWLWFRKLISPFLIPPTKALIASVILPTQTDVSTTPQLFEMQKTWVLSRLPPFGSLSYLSLSLLAFTLSSLVLLSCFYSCAPPSEAPCPPSSICPLSSRSIKVNEQWGLPYFPKQKLARHFLHTGDPVVSESSDSHNTAWSPVTLTGFVLSWNTWGWHRSLWNKSSCPQASAVFVCSFGKLTEITQDFTGKQTANRGSSYATRKLWLPSFMSKLVSLWMQHWWSSQQ